MDLREVRDDCLPELEKICEICYKFHLIYHWIHILNHIQMFVNIFIQKINCILLIIMK